MAFQTKSFYLEPTFEGYDCVLCFSNVHAVDGDDMTSLHYISKSKAALAVAVMQALLTAGPDIGNV